MARFAFVTGASSGLGRATALAFAKAGFSVLAGVRRNEDGESLRQADPSIRAIRIDLADMGAIDAAAAEVDKIVGKDGLAVLVNNAGYILFAPIEHAAPGDVSRLFDVLVFGPGRLTNALLPALARQASSVKRSRVLNIISWASLDAGPFVGHYAAAKAAFLRLTQAQQLEFDRYGIDATAIVPGLMKTPFVDGAAARIAATLASLPEKGMATYGKDLQRLEKMSKAAGTNPLARAPEAIARRIVGIATLRWVRLQYDIGIDTMAVVLMNRLLPFCLLRRIKFAMFGLARRERTC
jgi:NAD(P)-dependent dehydrogenase (short-subunit alcohol dehydrogenase family)